MKQTLDTVVENQAQQNRMLMRMEERLNAVVEENHKTQAMFERARGAVYVLGGLAIIAAWLGLDWPAIKYWLNKT